MRISERIITSAVIQNIDGCDVDALMESEYVEKTLTDMCLSELKKHLGVQDLKGIDYTVGYK